MRGANAHAVFDARHDPYVRAPLLLGTAVAALVILVASVWPHGSRPAPNACGAVTEAPKDQGLASADSATLCLINRERTSRGLAPLRENALLSAASLEHSRDMVARNYFEHTAADGRTVGDRIRAVGYQRGVSVSAGENIAYGVGEKSTPQSIVQAWMHSPGHRADILRTTFTDIGIGIALGAPEVDAREKSDGATYTTDFGGVPDPSLPNDAG